MSGILIEAVAVGCVAIGLKLALGAAIDRLLERCGPIWREEVRS